VSRVTKLQKHYRHLQRDKCRARRRYWAQSRRGRSGFGNLYHITRRERRDARQHSHHPCQCGHRLHGQYGCLHGCAWGWCGAGRQQHDDMADALQYAAISVLGALAVPRSLLFHDTALVAHLLDSAPKHPDLKERVAEALKTRPDLEVIQEGDLTLVRPRGTLLP